MYRRGIRSAFSHGRHVPWVPGVVVLVVLLLGGCGSDVPDSQMGGQLADGEKVKFVREEGQFTVVETSDGKQAFVPTERLIATAPSAAAPSEGDGLVVTTPTQFFVGDKPPEAVPERPEPRTGEEISKARDRLAVLFMTESGKEVYNDRRASAPFLDKESGELCWPAFVCGNPNCPGKDKGKNGGPFLFIWPDPDWKVNAEGEMVFELPPGKKNLDQLLEKFGTIMVSCPECLKIRNLQTEPPEQYQQYVLWVQRYQLPETTARVKEMNREHGERIRIDRAKRKRK